MSIIELLYPSYWFSLHLPNVGTGAGRLLFVVFAALIIGGVVLRALGIKRRKSDPAMFTLFSRFAALLLTMGIIGVAMYFFSYERVRFLGARFWYALWILTTLAWSGIILYFSKKKVVGISEEIQKKRDIQKYLPNGKN